MTLPLHADVRNGIRRWGMLGNGPGVGNPAPYKAGLGDCVEAMFLHMMMVKATTNASSWKKLLYRLGFTPPTPTEAIGLYGQFLATQGETLAQDPGTVVTTFLEFLKSQGNIVDWGSITLTSDRAATLDKVHQAMIDYRSAGLQVELTSNAYTDFLGGTPWHISTDKFDQPDPSLQHGVALVVYGKKYSTVVSWGQTKNATRAFMYLCMNGAYVFLTDYDRTNPNFAQLLANIKNL